MLQKLSLAPLPLLTPCILSFTSSKPPLSPSSPSSLSSPSAPSSPCPPTEPPLAPKPLKSIDPPKDSGFAYGHYFPKHWD